MKKIDWSIILKLKNSLRGKAIATLFPPKTNLLLHKIKPVKFEKRGDFYFIDFGKAAFATMDFTYNAKTPHTLTVRVGEMVDDKGNVNRTPPAKSNIRYQELKVDVKPGQTKYQNSSTNR